MISLKKEINKKKVIFLFGCIQTFGLHCIYIHIVYKCSLNAPAYCNIIFTLLLTIEHAYIDAFVFLRVSCGWLPFFSVLSAPLISKSLHPGWHELYSHAAATTLGSNSSPLPTYLSDTTACHSFQTSSSILMILKLPLHINSGPGSSRYGFIRKLTWDKGIKG